jgi:RHS repeat-associated protein
MVENTFYEPFGDVTSGGSKEVKLYTGQFDDAATGQDYYGARYYKPSMGKFIQADPMVQAYNPQSLNHYSYVLNNPYKYTDPRGLWTFQIGLSLTAGFVAGGNIEGGFILGYSRQGGFQVGAYGVSGGGLHVGQTGSLTVSFGTSSNDYITDVRGNAITAGGSADLGISIPGYTALGFDAGIETNEPITPGNPLSLNKDNENENPNGNKKIHPVHTLNLGIGTGTMAETHVYSTYTGIYQVTVSGNSNNKQSSKSGSGTGWSNVIPDPSGRKDKNGKPIYVARSVK